MFRITLNRAIVVALVVGTILILINQYEKIISLERLNIWKTGLSYIVPFCVSAYSSIVERRDTGKRNQFLK
ncbi:hypothetical protein GCM10009069_08330 [Algimonas arctica]|uniref:Dihydrolipoamide dehydrogenase n=1 Tax=Algimonas arctica TaxID=1479486 RepID=A0A8J3G1K0_9PROT|nr:hypothetical protein GCM10009069_08330 [Algimonas arctica]